MDPVHPPAAILWAHREGGGHSATRLLGAVPVPALVFPGLQPADDGFGARGHGRETSGGQPAPRRRRRRVRRPRGGARVARRRERRTGRIPIICSPITKASGG